MNKEDKKICEKFKEIIKNKPSNEEAVNFWTKLNAEEYDRLIYLFENNEIKEMPENVKIKLVEIFRKLKDRLGKI